MTGVVFVFVRRKEIEFIKQFFSTSQISYRSSSGNIIPINWMISGGDCNPIRYPEDGYN